MMKKLILLLFFIPFFSHAQTVCTPESRAKLESFLTKLESLDKNQSANELAAEIGQWFLKTEYVEKTLEIPGPEQLVINLQGVDCTTYLESVVALTRLAKQGENSMEAFEKELETIRYRHGKNEGYPSRLHYFSDWLAQNETKGILTDITQEIGGVAYPNAPTFMTENPQFYPQLSDPKNVEELKKVEAELAKKSFHYIPKDKVQSLESKIQSGDMIAITTSIKNLDMVHVGLAFERNGRIHLMHASSKNKEVEISGMPLSDYLAANKSQSGIMVGRWK
uniref:N-acetylmuramoyl-L-alanine amidase-like domain-containing protein n=1 Tax=Algoriphagus sp. TaxID=1872435 RepID=UPI0025844ADE|nr:N-acetylmuramoyl-L-alanine amidase-like domain-containing protein [Algoriphagus sp.]